MAILLNRKQGGILNGEQVTFGEVQTGYVYLLKTG
jgi:hypothetical protein